MQLEAVVAQHRALHERPCNGRVAVAGWLPAQRAGPYLGRSLAGHGGRDPCALGGELRARAQADQQPALAGGVAQG